MKKFELKRSAQGLRIRDSSWNMQALLEIRVQH
jgi:hypothetical protein